MGVVTSEETPEEVKAAKADFARAKIYLARGELLKSVEVFLAALRVKLAIAASVKDKSLLDPPTAEYCDEFSANFAALKLLESMDCDEKPFLKFRPGQDHKIVNKLSAFRLKIAARQEEEKALKERERRAKQDDMLFRARELFASGQAAKGKVLLKRAVEQFGRDADVALAAGELLHKAGYPGDAMDMLRLALEHSPKDENVYRAYLDACLSMGDREQAEAAYLKMLEIFGEKAQIYLDLSKLYLAWRKTGLAEDNARRALKLDASLSEAAEILSRCG